MLTLVGQSPGGAARRRAPYFRTKKLAIVGCTESKRFTPWTDPSWTIASHCSARSFCQREPDWWFDLHPRACFTKNKRWAPTYYKWLQSLTTPIFMQEAWPEIPAAVRFPKERLLAEFRPFFTNHVAWLIALAMTEGLTHVGLFGCQYKHETEHGVQRDSCIYWMGRFEGWGGTIVLPPAYNTLLNKPSKLYGYESHDADGNLVPEYQTPPRVGVLTPKGFEHRPLTLLAEGETPPHADLGVPVAWDRAGCPRPEGCA